MAEAAGLMGAAECVWPGHRGHHHWAVASVAGSWAHKAKLTDFGAEGDGTTSNTRVFAAAIAKLSRLAADGGAMLVVPPGKWLTGPF